MKLKRFYRKPLCEAIELRAENLCTTSMPVYDGYGPIQGAKKTVGDFEDTDDYEGESLEN